MQTGITMNNGGKYMSDETRSMLHDRGLCSYFSFGLYGVTRAGADLNVGLPGDAAVRAWIVSYDTADGARLK